MTDLAKGKVLQTLAGKRTFKIRLSLKTKLVMLATKMKRAGKMKPHKKMMP